MQKRVVAIGVHFFYFGGFDAEFSCGLVAFFEDLPSGNQTWQLKNPPFIGDYPIKPPLIREFPLPRLIASGYGKLNHDP